MKLSTKILIVVTIFVLLLLLAERMNAQTYSNYTGPYYDSTLDSINNGLAYLDSDLNAKQFGAGFTNALTLDQQAAMYLIQQSGGRYTNGINIYQFAAPSNIASFYQSNAFIFSSNFSSAVSNALVGPYSGMFDNTWTNGVTEGFSLNESSIPLGTFNGTSYSFPLGTSIMPTIFFSIAPWIRTVLLALESFGFFVLSMRYIEEEIVRTMNQRQVEGLKQEAFAANIDAPTAGFYAAVIVSALAALLGFFVADSAGAGASIGSFFSVLSTVKGSVVTASGMSGWDVVTSFVPISGILAEWFNYLAFRYLYGFPAFVTVKGLILFLLS